MFAAYEVDSLLGIVDAEPFGADDVTDLVLMNMKTADFIGHQYGPESPEIAEGVAAIDTALGRLVDAVEKKAGPGRSVVVITADHGMPALARSLAAALRLGDHGRPQRAARPRRRSASSATTRRRTPRCSWTAGGSASSGSTLADVRRHLESLPFVFAAYTEDEVRRAGTALTAHPDPAGARRITRALFAATGLGSAAFLASSTINAIVGARLGGADQWAGIPSATYQVGAAAAAVVWGMALDRLGRRPTLMLGMGVGAAGAAVAGHAVARHDLWWFLFGILLMGMAQSAIQLGRFVAAEVHAAADRGRAISRVVVGATVGAVFGPLAVGAGGDGGRARRSRSAVGTLRGERGPVRRRGGGPAACSCGPEPRELGRRVESAASAGAPVGAARAGA